MNTTYEQATVLAGDPANRPITDRTQRDPHSKDIKKMLLYEDMTRDRMREDQRIAAEQRVANRLQSIRRWERLAGWAAKRAARIRDR